MKSRRESLRIIGAVGTTCAFPFAADTLYGQHVHPEAAPAQIAAARPYQARNFSAAQFAVIARVADLIIPATETPGAVAAGVPQYIDEVVTANPPHKPRFEAGLEWMEATASERFGKGFLALTEAQQIEILTPLCDAVDKGSIHSAGETFFSLMKAMTADGYYTARIGLVDELGYKGNTVLGSFPECTHPEHLG